MQRAAAGMITIGTNADHFNSGFMRAAARRTLRRLQHVPRESCRATAGSHGDILFNSGG
jgi:hypothetical protein